MQLLIDKELNSNDKILKPDFNSRTGRELLAFYLQTKFKQIVSYDKRCDAPIFKEINPSFIQKFTRRLITNPHKRILIGITGESASGKSTICRELKNLIEQLSMPVSVLSTDNYFNDISELIKKYGDFDNLRDNGYDIDSPANFQLSLLKQDLINLSEGNNIKAPRYIPNGTGVSVPQSLDIQSDKLIVVEGIATMYEDVKDIFDVKIYIETDLDTRRRRFMKRAIEERNQNEINAQNDVIIATANGTINVIDANAPIEVYNIAGAKVATVAAPSAVEAIDLDMNGVFVVKVGDKVQKVIL